MKQINTYDEISGLISVYLRKGVHTNTFLTPDVYKAEIAAGSLYAHQWQGGLLILRKRQDFYRLNYYINDLASLPDYLPEKATVIEIPLRPGSGTEDIDYWQRQGFNKLMSRLRLVRPGGLEAGSAGLYNIKKAAKEEIPELGSLLESCFNPLTGCLPTTAQLKQDIESGLVFTAQDDKGISGLLRISLGMAAAEIRQLVVREDRRGRGIARALLLHYLKETQYKKSLVWTGQENINAIRLYEGCGYKPDGWTSIILLKD